MTRRTRDESRAAELRIADYVLGTLDAEDARAVEAAIERDPEVRRTAAMWHRVLGDAVSGLAASSPADGAATPPPSLKARLLDAARHEPFRIVREGDGIWRRLDGSAAAVKELYANAELGARTRLVRVGPTTEPLELAASNGASALSLFVVDGELAIDGDLLAADDFASLGGSSRASVRSTSGSTLLLIESRLAAAAPAIRRASDARWKAIAPGVQVRGLASSHKREASTEGDTGDIGEIMVMRMDPGTTLFEHEHDGIEELLMLDGDCTSDGVRLDRGDYHRASAASHHAATTTVSGCRMIVVTRLTARPAA